MILRQAILKDISLIFSIMKTAQYIGHRELTENITRARGESRNSVC